jgi:hypothetical protein
MTRHSKNGLLLGAVLVAGLAAIAFAADMPFGGDKDVAFGNKLWTGMDGYTGWKMTSDVYPGQSPHGKFVRLFYNIVDIDGTPYHVIVKDNYDGPDETTVANSPQEYLKSVTVMVQRKADYDPDNNNWYYVKYKPDGTIEKNPDGTALAGLIGKGSAKGCLPCHKQARGNDFIFSNDKRQ